MLGMIWDSINVLMKTHGRNILQFVLIWRFNTRSGGPLLFFDNSDAAPFGNPAKNWMIHLVSKRHLLVMSRRVQVLTCKIFIFVALHKFAALP